MRKTIDIFCDIIDNFGDIGVVYRLGKDLKKRNYNVRIFTNKLSEAKKIINNLNENQSFQTIDGIDFFDINNFEISYTAETIIEAFATEIPLNYIDNINENTKLIINLEYLSAEDWIEEYHLKDSFSPKPYVKKIFFMPGFTEYSGGVIIDQTYLDVVKQVNDKREFFFNNFFKSYGIVYSTDCYYINIFTYQWDFKKFIYSLKNLKENFTFFVLDNKLDLDFGYPENIKIFKIPYINQNQFDILLNLADFNFVRGEESFVRAILSEIPFLWHIYPQDDDIHLKKLNAFIENFNKYSKNKNDNNIYNLFTKFNEKLDFFDDFLKIKKSDNDIFREYKNYIVKNCNLVEKLLYYIDSRTNQTQEEI